VEQAPQAQAYLLFYSVREEAEEGEGEPEEEAGEEGEEVEEEPTTGRVHKEGESGVDKEAGPSIRAKRDMEPKVNGNAGKRLATEDAERHGERGNEGERIDPRPSVPSSSIKPIDHSRLHHRESRRIPLHASPQPPVPKPQPKQVSPTGGILGASPTPLVPSASSRVPSPPPPAATDLAGGEGKAGIPRGVPRVW